MEGPRVSSPSGPLEFLKTKQPFSNIEFNAKRFDGLSSLARILSQCRSLEYQTMVIEPIPSEGTLKSDDLELIAADCEFTGSTSWRLSFFTQGLSTIEEIPSVPNDAFLGYAIIKQNQYAGKSQYLVFESVLCRSRFRNNFLHCRRNYEVRVAGLSFSVSGNLYCQQNAVTNVCAHVALRTVLGAALPAGDISYEEINGALRKSGNPHVPTQGLSDQQIMNVIEQKGFRHFSGRFTKGEKSVIPYRKYLYGSVESGFPALLGFQFDRGGSATSGHIIPVLGHTFNEDTWIPRANFSYFVLGQATKYVPSESWVSTYVVHDDNWGSNYCIPRGYLLPDDVGIAIGILPSECLCDPIEAEAIAIDYLYSIVPHIPADSAWGERLRKVTSGWVVLRPVLLSGPQYVAHLREMKGWKSEQLAPSMIDALEALRGLLWVVEISYPELFPANRRKLGEIVLKAQVKPSAKRDFKSFLLARLPGALYVLADAQGASGGSFRVYATDISDHVPIIDLDALPAR